MPATGNALLAYNAQQPSTRQVNNLLRRTEVGRGMIAPLVEYDDGAIEYGVPSAVTTAGDIISALPEFVASIPGAVYDTATKTIPNMLTPGYDYSNTQQAARDSFDASGFAMTGGLAANAAGLVPKGAVGSAGARMAAPASRTVDDLGFYSKLDEVLGTFGDKDQITAKALQERGVKASEIEARGLAEALAGGPRPAGELRQVAQANPVEMRRVQRGGMDQELHGDQIMDEINRLSRNPLSATLNRSRVATLMQQLDELDRGVNNPTKWQSYSLDPDNPTYRETVLHLPEATSTNPEWRSVSKRMAENLNEQTELHRVRSAPAEKGAKLKKLSALQKEFGQLEAQREAIETSLRGKDFTSGHWNEPNVIAHARTSMNTTPDGRKAFLIDELQSDWGQKIRDSGGARDGEKIAGLRKRINNVLPDEHAQQWIDEASGDIWHAYDNAKDQLGPDDIVTRALDEANLDEYARLTAELQTAKAATTGHPLVNTSDQWQTTAMRQLLKQAVDEGADVVAMPSGQTVESFGMGGKSEGLAYAYDQMYPKNMRKILSKMDKGIAPEHINALASASGRENLGQGFTLFPITDPVRQSVAQGQPLFANPTNALAPYLATQESKER